MSIQSPHANVVALRKVSLPEIPRATAHSPGQRLYGSRNEVWLCPAYSGDQTLMLYIKPALKLRQVVAELLVAQVGHAMRLPCAQPYLVTVEPKAVGRPSGPPFLAFGSLQVGNMGLATPIKSLSIMLDALDKAKHSHGTAVLDELVGNSVRGPGDILFDPQGSVWLVDHEDALRSDLAPDEAVTNWLAAKLLQRHTSDERIALLAALRSVATRARTISFQHDPDALQMVRSGADAYQSVLGLVVARLDELDRLLSQRILPDQIYLDLPRHHNNGHDTHRPASI